QQSYSNLPYFSVLFLSSSHALESKNETTAPTTINPNPANNSPAEPKSLLEGKIISAVAHTIPNTQWETIAYCFLYANPTALERSRTHPAIPSAIGISTVKSILEMPASIGSYSPKNKSSVEELSPGTI